MNTTPLWTWTEPKKRIVWPENVYPAVVEDVLIDALNGKFGKLSVIVFQVSDPINGVQTQMRFAAYPQLSKTSRMGKAVQALGMPVGAGFSPSDLKGRQCRVLLKNTSFKDKTGADVLQSEIADILAVPTQMTKGGSVQ